MLIIGCDLHTRYQVIAMLNRETGELVTRRLQHENGEAGAFYASLPAPAQVGIEATGYTQWFERLMAELNYELWVGDAAQIRARAVRRQKTDSRDAEHLLELLSTQRFPRLWIPSPEQRDLRQLLKHRHKLVTMVTTLKNQLHFLAMSQGLCRRADSRSGRALSEQPAGGELSGPEPPRAFQRRSPAAGRHQQARQSHDALAAGGSGTDGGTVRSRTAPQVSTFEVPAGRQ